MLRKDVDTASGSAAVPLSRRGCWLAGAGVPLVTQRSRFTRAARSKGR